MFSVICRKRSHCRLYTKGINIVKKAFANVFWIIVAFDENLIREFKKIWLFYIFLSENIKIIEKRPFT